MAEMWVWQKRVMTCSTVDRLKRLRLTVTTSGMKRGDCRVVFPDEEISESSDSSSVWAVSAQGDATKNPWSFIKVIQPLLWDAHVILDVDASTVMLIWSSMIRIGDINDNAPACLDRVIKLRHFWVIIFEVMPQFGLTKAGVKTNIEFLIPLCLSLSLFWFGTMPRRGLQGDSVCQPVRPLSGSVR